MPGNTTARCVGIWECGCFNEAPAKCRGIHFLAYFPNKESACFNEAPAKCRGILGEVYALPGEDWASMRPQRNAGEYTRKWMNCPRMFPCFNEAPAKCRGIPYRSLIEAESHSRLQ